MKKALSIILICAIIISGLSACGDITKQKENAANSTAEFKAGWDYIMNTDSSYYAANDINDILKHAKDNKYVESVKENFNTASSAISEKASQGKEAVVSFTSDTSKKVIGTIDSLKDKIGKKDTELGTVVIDVIKKLIEDEKITPEQIRAACLSETGEINEDSFLYGALSSGIYLACVTGKFGAEFDVPPVEVVCGMTYLVLRAIQYAFIIADGHLSANEYLNVMIEELKIAEDEFEIAENMLSSIAIIVPPLEQLEPIIAAYKGYKAVTEDN